MAYGRRRSMYRRKGRRGNRTLSTRRIFNNKGAKAQAKQIYALRRSVNRVARMCKPEVKLARSDQIHGIIGLNNIYIGATVSNLQTYAAPVPALGTNDGSRIGNLISALPLKVSFASQYKKIINSVTTPVASKLTDTSGGVRMIVVQSKVATSTAPVLTDILSHTPTTLADSVGILNSTFVRDITARYSILYNRVFYYSENHLIRCKNLSIRPALRKIRWEDNQTYPAGQIWIFLVAGGFTYVDVGSGDNPYDYDVCDYSIKFEQPFTDA